jgi:hypothetical protein
MGIDLPYGQQPFCGYKNTAKRPIYHSTDQGYP